MRVLYVYCHPLPESFQPYIHRPRRTAACRSCKRRRAAWSRRWSRCMRACGGRVGRRMAIGSGGSRDGRFDGRDRVRGAAGRRTAYALRRVWLSAGRGAGRLLLRASPNEGLWPLCHTGHTRPIFRDRRLGINTPGGEPPVRGCHPRRGSSADSRIILVQDYHFMTLPQLDPRALAARDDHHVLAHPLAEPGTVWHLPAA